MKQKLRQIYCDLSNGKLSQKEAFEKIKAIKLPEQGERVGALLVTPVWQASGVEAPAEASKVEYAEHHVILCELSKVDAKELGSSVPHIHCLSLQAEGQKNIAQRYSEYALACFERIRAILQGKPQGEALVQIVIGDHQEQALFAGLSGLLKTAALENPRLIGQLILVPAQTTTEELGRLLEEEKTRRPTAGLDSLIRYKQGVWQVLRWQEAPEDWETPPIAFKDHGVYLITGGLGSLGLLFAREILAQASQARVVLTGRSALGAEKQSLLDELSAPGGRLSYRQVDLGDPDQVKGLIAGIQDECGQLNGILHCAGMIADNFILKKTGGEFCEVLAPKVTGTYNLDRASQDVELDFFALFSSIAGAMGNVGQVDYAAANGFMDQFAAYRNRQVAADERRGRTLSINWPLWQAGGMGIDPASLELLRQTTGLQPMRTDAGLQAFYRSLAAPYDQIMVVEGDLKQIRRALLTGRPIQPELAPPLTPVEQSVASETDAATIDSDGFVEKTQDYLRRQLSEQLKLPSHKIDPQAALEKYGIDSILAMKLTNQLEKTFGSLPKTLFFEYQTIRDLAEYFVAHHATQLATQLATRLTALLAPAADRQSEAAPSTAQALPPAGAKRISSRRASRLRSATPAVTTESDPIAIIGLSGRYPEAVDIEAYWRNLREGKDCVIEVPKDRWDWREYFSEDRSQSGRHYSKWGGFIAGVDEFDPLFFNMAPKEAKYIDPQERLFLQHVWMAIEDAGYTRASLQAPYAQDLPGQVGVYVGVMYIEYHLFGAEASLRGARLGIAGSAASIANRVSYALNLHGPSLTLDTMCSSSLTAIHIACQDLKLGRTSMAIAGGVNVSIHPNKYLALSAGQFISSDGHCQSFGEGGDGYIPGEGVGVVVLKRLSEAQRDGDHIYGIIRGSALNHGGKTNGYTVPNPQAQASAISRALAESRTDARHISYIEAHGTGTKLGDPIEIAALSKAFHQYTQETGFCLIGSVKSNIGHCESAAGVAGLTKVLLQMRHQQIAPSLHSAQLNPHIDFAKTPFVVNQELRSWEPPVIDGRALPRIAGISSFGAGGSNAHLIVEEYQEPAPQQMDATNVLIVLSARTAEQLRQKVSDLLEFVRPRLKTLDLAPMAYTLQVGREAMDERLGLVASSVEHLAEKLQAYLAGERDIEDAYQGQAKRNKEALSLFSADVDLQHTIDRWIANKKLSKLVELWAKGLEVIWSKLYGEVRPRRVSLPTYPFAKERYWVDTAGGRVAASVAPAVLHPLLHSNTSDLSHQSYSSTFSGEEFFLKDYQVDGQRILPSAAYLEMARAAVTKAARTSHETVLELRNVVWAQPIVGAQHKQISIALLAHDHDEIDYEIYSQDTDEEIVHCQGRAVLSRQPALAKLDLEYIKGQMGRHQLEPGSIYAACARMGLIYGPSFQGIAAIHRCSDQLLAQLRLPRTVEDTSGDYVLHPSLVDSALQAGVALMNGGPDRFEQLRLPFALDSLRIVSPCAREMVAWARYSPGSQAADPSIKLDIDLCDEQGNVCAQMRGVSLRRASLGIVESPLEKWTSPAAGAAVTDGALAAPMRKEIVLAPSTRGATAPVERKKPAAVALEAPGARVSAAAAPSANKRAPITLSTPGAHLLSSVAGSVAPAVSSVRLYDNGNGIFSIEIAASVSDTTQPKDVIAQLLRALDRARQEAQVKVLMLRGLDRGLLRGGREAYNEAVEQNLYQALVAFPYPLIALLQGDAIGADFLAAALCDFMVCNEDAAYGYTDAHTHLYPTTPETILFNERFGDVRAQDFLYASTAPTGKQLRSKGWTCPILAAGDVEGYARKLASALATKPQNALRLLKQHLTRHVAGLVNALTRVEVVAPATEDSFDAGEKTIAAPAKHIHLDASAEHVLVVKFGAATEVTDLVADLGHVFSQIHRVGYYKAIVLVSESPEFLLGTERGIPLIPPEDVALDFQRLVVESEIPIVAALAGNAKGAAWLVSQSCDACVYSRTGVYSSADIGQSPVLAQTAAAIFTHRFGADAGKEILLTGADYSGVDLQRRVGALIVTERDQALPMAVQVAASWAKLPRATLAAWKKHTATTLQEKIRNLQAADGRQRKDEALEPAPDAAAPIALHSKVVTATGRPDGVVVVKMEDREAKNMFSDALIEGVREAFAHIERTPAYKVVILTGYDSYFASGGTKESLLAIGQGKAKFTDVKIFQEPLDCKLPVIAAMQGHGIGAGWAMGLFADVVLLSEESRYVSPYMNYGFTPGAGATWILADKIGQDLARESLLTAQDYSGSELKDRGLRLPILPRAEVYPAAMELAKRIARVSRGRLIGLKRQLTGYVREALEETYRLELAMHEKTFVGRSGALEQIQNNFYPATAASPAGAQQFEVEAALASPSTFVDGDALAAVTASLKTLLADELQMRKGDLDENVEFVDLGLDSISGVAWVRKINEKYHTAIEATKVYNYPTLVKLSRYVKSEAEKHGALPSPGEMPAAPSGSRPSSQSATAPMLAGPKLASWRGRMTSRGASAPGAHSSQPVAVIGMAGQFPQAKNLEEFWQNIAQGKNCITHVAPNRWDSHEYYQPGAASPGKTNSQWVGALEEYDLFDPLFFNISPTEAESMDPQQRLFLQACWHSIENAGYDARVLSGSKCGVFVGCAAGDYHQLSRRHQLSAQGFTGGATSILAARISYFLNLQGPCISIDTACSSSLVAIAQACDSLTSGASDLALAGGVYVMAGPEMHIRTSQAAMLSPEGKCFTFDQRANGFVPGEGVGVVLLKRLADAQKDRDIIYGVIHGWGVNQDGRTNGITAPNPESQTRLEQEVYDKFQIDPASIQLIEAHGTGTKLGDPIEVEGLRNAFKKYTEKKGYCALGSVKSNIGHCLTAAGIASVIKLLLALKRRQLPPTINFERLNEHIDLTDSPFYVNTRLQEWDLKGADRRQAAISSFGFSGTNAHMVIGEYKPPAEVKRPVAVVTQNTKAIIPLSARTAEQLKRKACDLLDFIHEHEAQSIDLIEMAYTLQVGRQPMDERLGFVASSVEQLAEKLQAYLDGERGIEDAYQGQALRNNDTLSLFSADADLQQTIDRWIANKKLSKLLELWVKGLELDWSKLYGEVKPRRISLPTYPFAKERYWIDAAAAQGKAIGVLLATPVWQGSDVDASVGASQIEYTEHHVVLCELSDVNRLGASLSRAHCLSLQAESQKNISQRYSEYALACFERIQTILQGKPHGKALVQIVVPDHQEQALLAGLSGILRTAALENPQFVGQLILVPANASVEELARRLHEEKTRGPAAGLDALIRYEDGSRQVLRWQEVPEEQEEPPIAFRDHGVYLITGGMGGLGLLFAEEILSRTRQARVVLTGRSALSAEKQALLDGLSAQAGRVSYRHADISDLDQVTQLITAIKDEYGQLNGILHCAGIIADNFILKKTSAQFSEVLAPKVAGAFNLDQASKDVELDFFALFSSIAGAMGNLGQVDYAAANGFMDQFAAYRNRQVAADERRGRTLSINWPLWQAGGMRIDPASLELLRQATGLQPMRTATGLRAFYRILVSPYDQTLVVEGALPRITAYLQKARMFEVPSVLGAVASEAFGEGSTPRAPLATARGTDYGTPGAPLATAHSTDYANAETEAAVSLDQLQRQLKTTLATVLRIDTSIIDVDQPFVEFGLDSFLGAELVVAINRKYGTELSHITLFDYPTVREFSLFLEQEIKKSPGYSTQQPATLPVWSPAPAASSSTAPTNGIRGARTITSSQKPLAHLAHLDDKIAIVGMSGRYPQANNLQEYWANLVEGRNSIVEAPASRWDVNRYYDPDRAKKDKTYSKWVGALDDIDCFDPLFFRISPHEAEHMDPQHRLFLQESYKAFEDAGYSSNSLSNKKCGVYLGITTSEYMSLLLRNGVVSAPVTSNSYAIAAARIAYYLNLKGPAIAVDTACSSSLVAIHLASQALSSREIDMALAGGVSLWLTPESYIAMSQAGMFSPAGQCKTFDDTADGIVNGEGVGVLVLKRLRDAQEDNDFIYGVILGSGINQDGRTNGITAPSVNSQIELEREIYARHKIDPDTIGYVEAHGTGTKLGDPIELEALATVFKEKTTRKNYCGLGSVKSNIGHTTAAAGVAGVQKVLLSMRHRTLVPSLNVTKETSRFDFKNSPFYVVREKQTWDVAPGSVRRAAVSSFGFSGTNAHLVIEEYAPPPDLAACSSENCSFIVPLSAKTAEQLEEKARDLLKFIRASQERGQPAEESTPSSEPIDLAAVAYTLQVGRDAMEERLSFVVNSVDQLAEKLDAYISGERNIESAYEGRVEPGNEYMTTMGRDDDMQEVIDRWIARKKLAKLGQSWARGVNVDWSKLYVEAAPGRVSLPTYPFAKERYWVDEAPVRNGVERRFEVDNALKSIDDIMDKICDDAMETDQAVNLLKALV